MNSFKKFTPFLLGVVMALRFRDLPLLLLMFRTPPKS